MAVFETTITPRVDLVNGIIHIDEVETGPDLFEPGGLFRNYATRIVDTRDKAIRDALICLGWRPPPGPYQAPTIGVREHVRANDAGTSIAAAEKAKSFAAGHCELIAKALGDREMTSREISHHTGLSMEQVARRMPDMRNAGQVDVVVDEAGNDVERGGCRVWRRIK